MRHRGLSAFGIANMLPEVFADVGVAVLAILNAVRALSVREKYKTPLKSM